MYKVEKLTVDVVKVYVSLTRPRVIDSFLGGASETLTELTDPKVVETLILLASELATELASQNKANPKDIVARAAKAIAGVREGGDRSEDDL